jgi:hypothetical protein
MAHGQMLGFCRVPAWAWEKDTKIVEICKNFSRKCRVFFYHLEISLPWCSTMNIQFWYNSARLLDTRRTLFMTRFAWWRQDLHAIELLRAHIGEWTMTQMLDYWWVMCFTSYRLNWNPLIWIPFPIDSDCTLLCAQVDRTRYSSIASGNNCIVQLCKCVSLHL